RSRWARTMRSCGELAVLAHLLEYLVGVTRGLDGSGHSAVDGDLQNDLLQLIWGEAVANCAAHVQLELGYLAERRDHAEVDEAALARLDAVAGPDRAPAVLGDEFLQLLREFVRVRL